MSGLILKLRGIYLKLRYKVEVIVNPIDTLYLLTDNLVMGMSKFKKNILIVDDDKELVSLLGEMLNQNIRECKIVGSVSPSEAYMRSASVSFDLIIADFRMPKTNGADLIKSIRKIKINKDVPVIMISGFSEELAEQIIGLDSIHILPKPFDSKQLMSAVKFILEETA